MSIYIFLFFLLSLSTAQDDCNPKTCSDHGPPIRFPFRLNNHHPPQGGCPGFDLSCSPDNTATVLDLPNSVKVLVTRIDYKSRLIHIKDPNSCFPQQLQNLNLSTTPFQFADLAYNFCLFSCPLAKSGFSYRATCLGGYGREVYAEKGEVRVYYADDPHPIPLPMLSCRKIYNLSVPIKAFHQADLQLKWPRRVCDLKCDTEDRGEELGIHIQDEGDAKIAKKLAIVGLWCIQWYPVDRPSMHGVIQMLEGDGDTLIKPPNPFASTNPTLAMGQSSGRTFNNELEVIVESE